MQSVSGLTNNVDAELQSHNEVTLRGHPFTLTLTPQIAFKFY